MNNTLQIFKFNSHDLRVITDSAGEPWFIAVDVCVALKIGNTTDALNRLDDDEKQVIDLYTLDSTEGAKNNNLGNSQINIINESGLYSLILGSRKPEAKPFKKWVTSEVLPSIRKTGSYSMLDFNVPKTFAEALRLAADAQEKLEASQAIVEKQQKTISVKDDLIRASNEASIKAGEILIREFVKSVDIINLGEKQFYQWMREQNIIMESREPYSEYVKAGYFTWKPTEIKHGGEYRYTLRVTPRGRVWLAAKYMAYIDTRLSVELCSLVA